jgi:hypothetical protein
VYYGNPKRAVAPNSNSAKRVLRAPMLRRPALHAARARKQNEPTTLQVSGRLARNALPNLRADAPVTNGNAGLRKEPPSPRCICPRDRTPSRALLMCGPRAHVAARGSVPVPEWDIENCPARTTFLGRTPQESPQFPTPTFA